MSTEKVLLSPESSDGHGRSGYAFWHSQLGFGTISEALHPVTFDSCVSMTFSDLTRVKEQHDNQASLLLVNEQDAQFRVLEAASRIAALGLLNK